MFVDYCLGLLDVVLDIYLLGVGVINCNSVLLDEVV